MFRARSVTLDPLAPPILAAIPDDECVELAARIRENIRRREADQLAARLDGSAGSTSEK